MALSLFLLGRLVFQLIGFGVMLVGVGGALIAHARNSYRRGEAMYDEQSRRESLLAVAVVVVLGAAVIAAGITLVIFGVNQ